MADAFVGIHMEVKGLRRTNGSGQFAAKNEGDLAYASRQELVSAAQDMAAKLREAQIARGHGQKEGHRFGGDYGPADRPQERSEDLWLKSVKGYKEPVKGQNRYSVDITNPKYVTGKGGGTYNLMGLLTKGTSGGQMITAHNGAGVLSIYDRRGQRNGGFFPFVGRDGHPAQVRRAATRGDDFIRTVAINEHNKVRDRLQKTAGEATQTWIFESPLANMGPPAPLP